MEGHHGMTPARISSAAASRAAILALALVWLDGAAAAPAAVVTHLSGTLAVLKADGRVRILSRQSSVEGGDTLSTQRDTYARLHFSDGGVVTLRPNTSFKLESYAFDRASARQDSYAVALLKGGLRALSGLIGKRGNPDAYRLRTPTATVGIRGTELGVLTCDNDCPGLANGTYTHTYDGILAVANNRGGIECVPGEVCYAGTDAPPSRLDADPGVDFTTPEGFDDGNVAGLLLDDGGVSECIFR